MKSTSILNDPETGFTIITIPTNDQQQFLPENTKFPQTQITKFPETKRFPPNSQKGKRNKPQKLHDDRHRSISNHSEMKLHVSGIVNSSKPSFIRQELEAKEIQI